MALLKVFFVLSMTHQSSYFLSFGLFAAEGFPSNVLSSLVNCSGRMRLPPPRGKKELSRNYMCEHRIFASGLYTAEFYYGV